MQRPDGAVDSIEGLRQTRRTEGGIGGNGDEVGLVI